jgi:hypothetical protein
MRIRTILIAAGTVAVIAAPATALAATNDGTTVLGGQRNPTLNHTKTYGGETQFIAKNDTYGTRQSNKGTGGGAIYGCRSIVGAEACISAVNLNVGAAFDFSTQGLTGGLITVGSGGDTRKPFTTNATGVATGLNADRVDSKSAADITKDATDASAKAATTLVASTSQTAQVSDTGALSKARGASAATRTAAGVYDVTFSTDVSACLPTGTVGGTTGGQLSVTQPSASVVHVTTFAADGTAADKPFSLLVTC